MPCLARLDAPGVFYQIVAQGIKSGESFQYVSDRRNLVDNILAHDGTLYHTWARYKAETFEKLIGFPIL